MVPMQKIHGRVHDPEDGPHWLELLPPPSDDNEPVPTVYLRYALTEMGTERPVFPAVVLDDWGKERKGLGLYRWIREEGDMFPRAEVFGYTAVWQEEQIFLRDLELHVRYPVLLYPTAETPQEEGRWLRHVVVVNTAVDTPTAYPQPTPEKWPFPLHLAKVTWWQIPPNALETFRIPQT